MKLNTIFTDKVQSMQPYHVPQSVGMIKLDAMESPYKLPKEMLQAIGTTLSMVNFNRYPSPRSTSLVAKIKNTFQLPSDSGVILGNGSDELIQMILTATMRPGATVMSPVPSFVMYQQTAEILGMKFIGVDLNACFSLDEDKFLNAIDQHQPAVIFLAYPNNPTGQILDKKFIEQVLKKAPGVVVLDEAYSPYTSHSVIDFIDKYNNAILIRTFSKIGLAGVRLGYLVANPEIVAQVDKVRMPYNINVLSKSAVHFMLDQVTFINACVEKVIQEKTKLYDWLLQREELTVIATETNFLLVRFHDANEVFTHLRDEHNILLKNLHGSHPTLENILRITIGRKKENEKLRQALNHILAVK